MSSAGWILILFAHVGVMGDGNSNSLTTAVYSSAETCAAAGNAAKKLAKGSFKEIEWVCTKQ